MKKMVECARIDPSAGCNHVIRGDTEAEVLERARDHARTHGLTEVTPELLMKLKAAIHDASGLDRKAFGAPDEVRPFAGGKGKMEIVSIGGVTIGRGTFEPGWRWSEHVKPIAKTDSCRANHTGYMVRGRMVVRMDDGSEMEFGPGDSFVMPPGHDAWVAGTETCVLIDFTGVSNYAKT